MLHWDRRSYLVASAAVFAAVYAILGLIPISPYVGDVGVRSFLTFREILPSLAGMLFGPLGGALSMVVGNFVDFAFGKPVVFDFLDFVPDLASAVVAGLVFTGRGKIALALPLVLILWYTLDPLSANLVSVAGTLIPFYWMHLLSVIILGVALFLERHGFLSKIGPAFVAATTFASTMTGHIAGSILYENISVRVNHVLDYAALQKYWTLIFLAYPAERILFTVLGTVVAVPILRALLRRRRQPPS